jgi:hypothetical protein
MADAIDVKEALAAQSAPFSYGDALDCVSVDQIVGEAASDPEEGFQSTDVYEFRAFQCV